MSIKFFFQVEAEVRYLKQEVERNNGGSSVHLLKQVADLENLSILDLKQIYIQLKNDIDKLEKVFFFFFSFFL